MLPMSSIPQSPPPLTALNFGPQKDGGYELQLSKDRNFASHGKVMMLVLVVSFASFFLSLLIFLYAKRPGNSLPLLTKSDPTAEPEIHPSINFPGPLVSGRTGQRPGPGSSREPEESCPANHQIV